MTLNFIDLIDELFLSIFSISNLSNIEFAIYVPLFSFSISKIGFTFLYIDSPLLFFKFSMFSFSHPYNDSLSYDPISYMSLVVSLKFNTPTLYEFPEIQHIVSVYVPL